MSLGHFSHLRDAAAIGVLMLGMCVAPGCRKEAQGVPPGGKMPPPNVNATLAIEKVVPTYLDEIGAAVASETVTIMPQIAGRVDALHFVDGADLKKGQLLFTIDVRPFQAILDQANGQLGKDQATQANADRFLNRQSDIYKQGFVSPSDYDTALFNARAAKAAVDADKAAVESAKLNVEYCQIRSPLDGRAGRRLVDPGNIVKINETALLVIQKLNPIYADFTINERDLQTVRKHMADHTLKALVRIPNDAREARAGDLTFLDNAVSDNSGTIKLRATLPNPDRHFWPGQYVNVRLVLNETKAVLVESSALQLSQKGPFVYVVKPDNTADLRPVVLGQQQGNTVVVSSGVHAGEMVITNGQVLVFPGGPVNVQPAVAQPQETVAGNSESGADASFGAPATAPATAPTTGIAPEAHATTQADAATTKDADPTTRPVAAPAPASSTSTDGGHRP